MWGASTRNYHLLKALASKHTVSLLALVEGTEGRTYVEELQGLTHELHMIAHPTPSAKRREQLLHVLRGSSYILNSYSSREMQEKINILLSSAFYDVVFFESIFMAGYKLPAQVKMVIDQHNIEYELLQRTFERETSRSRKWYNWVESQLIKPVEIARCRAAQVVVMTSEREQQVMKNILPNKVIEVVPNGVDTEAFRGGEAQQVQPTRIVFTGTMDYYPNIDAVLFFAEQCWPYIRRQVPEAEWQIVGRNPPAEIQQLAERPGISVTGSVPTVKPYLEAAAIAIAPLRIGSGTRLKILEAMAMEKAVVSTSAGCEGLAVESGKHLIVADEPAAFAQAIISLMKQPDLRTSYGLAGRMLVEHEYSWKRCGETLLQILEKNIVKVEK